MRQSFARLLRDWLIPALAASLMAAAQAGPAAAQQTSGQASPNSPQPLRFLDELDGDPVREMDRSQEGHVTLVWTPDPEADGYRVTNQSGHVMYEGRIRQAFLSGMLDGVHEFRVASVNAEGEVIREGPQPVTVTVEHWSLVLTWTLFGVGAVVMLALVAVLVIGARKQRKGATP